jgi:hypothetical protein
LVVHEHFGHPNYRFGCLFHFLLVVSLPLYYLLVHLDGNGNEVGAFKPAGSFG